MSILPIVTYNDPILREKANEVESRTEYIDRFVEDLIETMYHSNGLGLAAPQVGASHRIFVFDPDPVLEEDEEKDSSDDSDDTSSSSSDEDKDDDGEEEETDK